MRVEPLRAGALLCLQACLAPLFTQTLGQGLDVLFVLEVSPGTEQQIGLIRSRDLKEDDRAGVIGFTRSSQLLLPLTGNRKDLDKALQRSGIRAGVGIGAAPQSVSNYTVDLTSALREAFGEFRSDAAKRRRVVIVLIADEDPGLAGNLDSLRSMLAANEVRLFAVAITRVSGRSYSFPTMTARFLDEMAKGSRGKVFRSGWDLPSILAAARKP